MTDLDIETAEAKMTLAKVLEENTRLKDEVQKLREKATVQEVSTGRMTQSLALASSEAEVFRRQAGELKLRLEALGVEGTSGAASKVEQRLLNATSDLRLAQQDATQLREALTALSDAARRLSQKPTDAEAKRLLDNQLRDSAKALAVASPKASAPAPATMTDASVINISDELALVVANIGSRQGVTAGMPFQVIRDDHLIGTVRVVEVRERIAGAIIENLSSEKDRIKVGDRIKVAVRP